MEVSYMQSLLPRGPKADGDFGPITDGEVRDFQRTRGLEVDGVVGQQTWAALEAHAPPIIPEPAPGGLSVAQVSAICKIADDSAIAGYSWHDRGSAPPGYTRGIAVAFAQSLLRWHSGHAAVVNMARRNTGDDDIDALSWYNSDFSELGMSNDASGTDTLRHLYVLLMGLGMRESSGRHCEGRDQSADNVSSDTAEAGMYQTSYNASNGSSPEFDELMDEFARNPGACYLYVFADGVSCSESDWACYGSGRGYEFQTLCKSCPAFAVESCGLTLRNLRQHYGPINRKEAELRSDADDMLSSVQNYIEGREVIWT
jgi:hypothetical protein